jgi:hypothetical protein
MNTYFKIMHHETRELHKATVNAVDSLNKAISSTNPKYTEEYLKNYRLFIKKAEGILNCINLIEKDETK